MITVCLLITLLLLRIVVYLFTFNFLTMTMYERVDSVCMSLPDKLYVNSFVCVWCMQA